LNVSTQTLSVGNVSTGDELTCKVVSFDGDFNGTEVESSVFLVEDAGEPVLSSFIVPSVAYTDEVKTLSVNCADDNIAFGYPKVEFIDPNGLSIGNLSLALDGGGWFSRSYTFSVVGNYHSFKSYCKDGNGYEDSLEISDLTTVSVRPTTAVGGGAGAVIVVPELPVCDVSFSPSTLLITESSEFFEIILTNNDVGSWSPDVAFVDLVSLEVSSNGEGLSVSNPAFTLLPSKSSSFGVMYSNGVNVSGRGDIVLSSSNCADVVVPLIVDFGESSSFDLLDADLKSFFSEGVFENENLGFFTVFWLVVSLFLVALETS